MKIAEWYELTKTAEALPVLPRMGLGMCFHPLDLDRNCGHGYPQPHRGPYGEHYLVTHEGRMYWLRPDADGCWVPYREIWPT